MEYVILCIFSGRAQILYAFWPEVQSWCISSRYFEYRLFYIFFFESKIYFSINVSTRKRIQWENDEKKASVFGQSLKGLGGAWDGYQKFGQLSDRSFPTNTARSTAQLSFFSPGVRCFADGNLQYGGCLPQGWRWSRRWDACSRRPHEITWAINLFRTAVNCAARQRQFYRCIQHRYKNRKRTDFIFTYDGSRGTAMNVTDR